MEKLIQKAERLHKEIEEVVAETAQLNNLYLRESRSRTDETLGYVHRQATALHKRSLQLQWELKETLREIEDKRLVA